MTLSFKSGQFSGGVRQRPPSRNLVPHKPFRVQVPPNPERSKTIFHACGRYPTQLPAVNVFPACVGVRLGSPQPFQLCGYILCNLIIAYRAVRESANFRDGVPAHPFMPTRHGGPAKTPNAGLTATFAWQPASVSRPKIHHGLRNNTGRHCYSAAAIDVRARPALLLRKIPAVPVCYTNIFDFGFPRIESAKPAAED